METHLAELSRSIDPVVLGRRMKIARIAAGMTQSQVAGDDASTAYISRIEDGQRRPEAHLLERMATRMGTTLEELLIGVTRSRQAELRVALDHAELALVSGDTTAAMAGSDTVLAELADHSLPDLDREAEYLRARVLAGQGRPAEAIGLLEASSDDAASDLHSLKALILLSRCYRESGDLARAVEIGERAAERITALGLDGHSEAIELDLTLAAAHLGRGDLERAVRVCRAAIDSADAAGTPAAKATAYWTASTVELRDGSAEAALQLAEKARALFEVAEDARNLGRLRTQLASMQLKLDPAEPNAAAETLEAAERAAAWPETGPDDKAAHHLTLARARFLLGDHASARARIQAGVELTGPGSVLMLAEARTLEGQIAAAEGDQDSARTSYREAVGLLTGIDADRDLAQLWFELATLLDDLGEHDDARAAYKHAASSTGLRSVRTRQLG